jgi:RNA polymerase sigma-70 factor (ECF subfamily)
VGDADAHADAGPQPLECYRNYVLFIARVLSAPRFRNKLRPSDLAQETLLKAHKEIGQFRGKTDAEFRGWLRRILLHTAEAEWRRLHTASRNVDRECSFEEALEQSSARLEAWLTDASSRSDANVDPEDQLDAIAKAVNELPEHQRTAFESFYIHGFTVAQISQQMDRSTNAVGALIARAVKTLRQRLA